ncbi:MAG: DUF4381 domain-containing protein [Paracoccaceae bacterium]
MSAQDASVAIYGSNRMWGLKELPLPEPVSWMPQTAGWAVVAIIALAAAAYFAWRRWQAYQADQYRRDALARIKQLNPDTLHDLPELLRLAALAVGPRDEVASLRGPNWINWLNARIDQPLFNEADSVTLDTLAYTKTTIAPEQARHLLDASESWLRGHHA